MAHSMGAPAVRVDELLTMPHHHGAAWVVSQSMNVAPLHTAAASHEAFPLQACQTGEHVVATAVQ